MNPIFAVLLLLLLLLLLRLLLHLLLSPFAPNIRLARCVHLAEIFTSVENGIQMLTKSELSNAVRRLIRLFLVVVLAVHTFACVWLFIAEFTKSNMGSSTEIHEDWLTRDLSNPSTNIPASEFLT